MVRPASLKYYTKTRDFKDVFVVGGHRAAYRAPVRRCSLPWGPHSALCISCFAFCE